MTYKGLGYSVIGMTNMPEAKLAREAELCYATVAMVTDFDCWHPDHDAVTVQDIIKVLTENADKAKQLVARLAKDFPREHEPCPIGSDRALDTALITAPEARDKRLLKKLEAVAGRVLKPVRKKGTFKSPFVRRGSGYPATAFGIGGPGSRLSAGTNGESFDAIHADQPSRRAISRAAMVPAATAVATHGWSGLATSPTAKMPGHDVCKSSSTQR